MKVREMEKTAAIILNYNSLEDTKRCVGFLLRQKNVNLQIIIVDNCSREGVRELKEFAEETSVYLIESRENRGYSAGNNLGLKTAAEMGCAYAIVVNPDVEISDEQFVRKATDKMNEDAEIVVLGPDVIDTFRRHQNPMEELNFFREFFWRVDLAFGKWKRKISYSGKKGKSGYCKKISGCCFVIRMSFAEQIGYFDENVFLYCEEPILAAIVRREGKREYYMTEIVAFHNHKESEKGNKSGRVKELCKSRIYYLENYSSYHGIRLKLLIGARRRQCKYFLRRCK